MISLIGKENKDIISIVLYPSSFFPVVFLENLFIHRKEELTKKLIIE